MAIRRRFLPSIAAFASVAAVSLAATIASAQQPAPPPPGDKATVSVSTRDKYDLDGVRITPGWAFTEDLDHGFFGRLELESFSVKHKAVSGATWGALFGFEGWGDREGRGGGGGIPISFYRGYRTSGGLFASLGAGWSWAIYDRVDDRGGFGIFAPLATATAGIDGAGFRVLADVRAQYRWEWGAEDRYQLMAGLSISWNDQDQAPRPVQSARLTQRPR